MEQSKTQVNFSEVILKEVSFLRPGLLDQENYQIDVGDQIDISDVTDKSFRVLYTRKTRGDIPFKFSVSFELVVFLGQEGIDHYQGDVEKILNFAEARKVEIVNNMALPARASLLIGNIVKELGNPFITQPAVIIGNHK